MLCGSPLGASLNGSQVSILPVARSSLWTPAKPLFCVRTLPSTCELCGLTMFTCAERVAADAAQHRVLLLIAAGKARKPFAVGELSGEIFGLAELEVEFRTLLRDDVYVCRTVE